MSEKTTVPGLRASTMLLAALSLSVGWGIRGNFGHEYGAMIPGALTGIAVCLLSGREDWRRRVAFFGMFGALGWAFGATISYMQVIAYTHSGHLPSQAYGFACLFVIGFLWGAMGGTGTALPAVLDRERLTAIFRPMCWILVLWFLLYAFQERVLEQWVAGFTNNEHRHESPLYWFDADWIPALAALIAVCAFDLWDRRFEKALGLPLFGAGGALAGFLAQQLLNVIGLTAPLVRLLLHYQGDTSVVPAEELMINWPLFFRGVPQHLGWIFGLIAGVGLYFALYGKFRSGSSLFAHMAVGWFAGFLLFPVLLGIRMTPPRADDWAGILGLYAGAVVYFLRNGMGSVVYVSIISGFVGGLGFSGVQMFKLLLTAPGNPNLVSDPAAIQAWAHWQSANWHSWLEQTYGFVNGIGIAVAMGLLSTRVARVKDEHAGKGLQPLGRWTEVFAVTFVLFVLTYLNLFKNVEEWTKSKVVPAAMKMPLIQSIDLSAATWFTAIYVLLTAGGVLLMAVHLRRRLAFVPSSWLGKGQLLYLAFLWAMIVGNFERALPNFSQQRLLTEGTIFVNGVIVTVLLLLLPKDSEDVAERPVIHWPPLIWRAIAVAIIGTVAAMGIETGVTRLVYGDKFSGHAGVHKRFGPDATWRAKPLKKGQTHS